MMGSWAGFPHGISTWTPQQLAAKEKEMLVLQATRKISATDIDGVEHALLNEVESDARLNTGTFPAGMLTKTVGGTNHASVRLPRRAQDIVRLDMVFTQSN
jgi:hypothetical protein